MSEIPTGVELYIPEDLGEQNVIVAVSGGPKTGKSNFATHVQRPLYYVMLDTHDNIRALLADADTAYEGPVYIKRIRSMRYDQLTEQRAQAILDEVEDFAAWARTEARIAKSEGRPTGTFVLDGMKRFKGYVEKAKLGESITLGWRPTRGGSSISRFEYAEANTYLVDFLAAFTNTPLDVVVTFEGTRKYVGNDRTDEFRSGAPDGVGYVVNAEVITMMDKEPIVANQQVVGYRTVPKMKIVFNAFSPFLNDRVMKGQTLDELKSMFGLDPVQAEEKLDAVDATHEPALVDPFGATATEPSVS